MAVGFAGDWHGNDHWATQCVRVFGELGLDTVYHLGDFGLWPGYEGKHYLRRLHEACETAGVTLFITLGNHEDYDRVALMRTDEDGWLFLKDYPLFRFAPRGHVWRVGDVVFASLGGAGSIDKHHRKPGRSWWPQEAIVAEDVAALRDNLALAGLGPEGRVDVMLTHEAPAGLRREGMVPRPSWLSEEVEHYCWSGRVVLAEAVELARPHALLHGHWHDWYQDEFTGAGFSTRVWGLPEDGNFRNCLVGVPVAGVGLVEARLALAG